MLCSTELPAVPALLLSLLPASALPAHLPLRPDGAEHPAAARAGLQSAPPPRLHDPVLYQASSLHCFKCHRFFFIDTWTAACLIYYYIAFYSGGGVEVAEAQRTATVSREAQPSNAAQANTVAAQFSSSLVSPDFNLKQAR